MVMNNKKGILFLNGGGSALDSLELDRKFVSCLEDGSRILYIPHANKKQYPYFSSSLEWIKNTVNDVSGNKKINIDMPMFYYEFNFLNLEDYDAIYIGGGNTFFLLSILKRYGVDKRLIDYYKKGGIIYGGSAGALILGKSIDTVSFERNNELESSDGLNILNGFSVVCHADKDIIDSLKDNNYLKPVLVLYEETGVVWEHGDISGYGKNFEIVD